MPLSRASIRGVSPNREPIRVNELPSPATTKSNSPPAIRCASGAGVARGCASFAAAGACGGRAGDEGGGAALGVDWEGLERGQKKDLGAEAGRRAKKNCGKDPKTSSPIST